MKKYKNLIIGIAVVAVIGGLFVWPIINDETRGMAALWNDADVNCISGHGAPLQQHIHQLLLITVDGVEETINENFGIVRSCMGELHVHGAEPNKIHLESLEKNKEFTLEQFFVVYGTAIEREGYTLEAFINGEPYEGVIAELTLEDQQSIELEYSSIE
ncbi:MAG: hypothetical protein HYS87_02650 [Candidatus Colwellbacteria bacterium]|nr:hypothetical protein [Candidatus Colwellbacteria bacterium]